MRLIVQHVLNASTADILDFRDLADPDCSLDHSVHALSETFGDLMDLCTPSRVLDKADEGVAEVHVPVSLALGFDVSVGLRKTSSELPQ